MDRIRIVGGSKLNGTIPISGAKNAALPLMIAGLLSEETLVLDNVPRLARTSPQYMTTTERLGRAMISVARNGYPKPVLESEDINRF